MGWIDLFALFEHHANEGKIKRINKKCSSSSVVAARLQWFTAFEYIIYSLHVRK